MKDRAWEWISRHLDVQVQGLITVSVLLAAEGAAGETYAETVAAVVLAMILYWLAHAYAASVARRMRESERLTASGFVRAMRHELSILIGATVPLLAVLVAWAADARLNTAINVGVGSAAAAIVVLEIAAGVRAELSGRDLAIQALVGAALGLLVLALRVVLH